MRESNKMHVIVREHNAQINYEYASLQTLLKSAMKQLVLNSSSPAASTCYRQKQYRGNRTENELTAFWDLAPCIHLEYRRFRGTYCHHQGDDSPDDGSRHLSNFGLLQQDCTTLYPRRLSFPVFRITLKC
jgi:hypothetical protein